MADSTSLLESTRLQLTPQIMPSPVAATNMIMPRSNYKQRIFLGGNAITRLNSMPIPCSLSESSIIGHKTTPRQDIILSPNELTKRTLHQEVSSGCKRVISNPSQAINSCLSKLTSIPY
ncbi:hypothetical protein TIFTF001_016420 [Ficus carica]|uniref:Uncharacterized protein n=1 Tax=Ficus carica TaxID=3494 RepID=A0AA88D7E5_FICCA|nr:hypothetical protein TIFTF001_016420 [Ficus carica]